MALGRVGSTHPCGKVKACRPKAVGRAGAVRSLPRRGCIPQPRVAGFGAPSGLRHPPCSTPKGLDNAVPQGSPFPRSTCTSCSPPRTESAFSRIIAYANGHTPIWPALAAISVRRPSSWAESRTTSTFSAVLAKTLSISDFIRELKRESSKWLKDQSPDLSSFFWQGGYGAFSISPGHVEALTRYIARQEDHHKTETFQEEFRRLLGLYGIEFDERYVWD